MRYIPLSQTSYAPGNLTIGPGFPIQVVRQFTHNERVHGLTSTGTLYLKVSATDIELGRIELGAVWEDMLYAHEIIPWWCCLWDSEVHLESISIDSNQFCRSKYSQKAHSSTPTVMNFWQLCFQS